MLPQRNSQMVIVNAGGQYCHLIARRVREAGVQARICSPSEVMAEIGDTGDTKGVIISGGPDSVYAPDALSVPRELFDVEIPVFGICYGHQLIASMLGG